MKWNLSTNCRNMAVWRPLPTLLWFFLLYSTGTKQVGADIGENDPDFANPISNVTVALGREAILACSVTDLGHYKVGWLKAEDQTILSLHTRVVTHNSRISVTHDNQRTWRLHIRQLKESDRGCYMCQINTSVMKKQVGCVDVHVPPDIMDSGTSSDVTVQEGGNASLVCKARGHPHPKILWRREDGEHILIKTSMRDIRKVDTYNGTTLLLMKLDRTQMGAYLCIATNDVPPAVSKRITLNINFAPVIKVPNQLLGSPVGSDVTMTCHIEAYPNTINYWVKNRGQMLLNGPKHIVDESRHSYRVHLKLTVKRFNSSDVGTYLCVSTNSLGRAEGAIRLYEIKIPTTTTTTTTTTEPTTTTVFEVTTPKRTTVQPTREIETLAPEYRGEDDDAINEVDTSSVKTGSGRNSRRRSHQVQHYSAAASLTPLKLASLLLSYAAQAACR